MELYGKNIREYPTVDELAKKMEKAMDEGVARMQRMMKDVNPGRTGQGSRATLMLIIQKMNETYGTNYEHDPTKMHSSVQYPIYKA